MFSLAKMDLNKHVLELVTFDDGDPLDGSYANLGFDIKKDGRVSSGSDGFLMILTWRRMINKL